MKCKQVMSCLVALSILLCGCSTLKQEMGSITLIKTLEEVNFNELQTYRDVYIGDNSAVSAIINNLPGNSYVDGFELKTNEPPYKVIINYDKSKVKDPKESYDFWNENTKTLFLNNAKVMFALIHNVDFISFQMGEEYEVTYSRNELEIEQGQPLTYIVKDKNAWDKFINQIPK
ncbi:MAG: DUF4825 domain-containing protein [Turicibacter sp.]